MYYIYVKNEPIYKGKEVHITTFTAVQHRTVYTTKNLDIHFLGVT